MLQTQTLDEAVNRVVDGFYPLSKRQRECLLGLLMGLSQGDIADVLEVNVRTVQSHLYEAYVRLGLAGQHASPSQKFMSLIIQELLKMAAEQEGQNANE